MTGFVLVSPATRGLSLALTRLYLRTTDLPVVATYRPRPPGSSADRSPADIHASLLDTLPSSVDPARLHVLALDLLSEASIAAAASALSDVIRGPSFAAPPYIHTAFFTGGVLHPERTPAALVHDDILETFHTNVVAHLLLIKHFSPFLPAPSLSPPTPAKWVHVSARVGSVSDNHSGGWYSYRASKAALNQVIRTFDLHLRAKRIPAIAVGVHPGTVKTDLSKAFWKGVSPGKLFEPDYAAARLADVVAALTQEQRGKVWDWKGEEILP